MDLVIGHKHTIPERIELDTRRIFGDDCIPTHVTDHESNNNVDSLHYDDLNLRLFFYWCSLRWVVVHNPT